MNETTPVNVMLDRMREHWISAGGGVHDERDAFHALSQHFPPVREGIDEHWQPYGGVPSCVTVPRGVSEDTCPVVLYIHGGAFLIGSAQIYRYQSSQVARSAGAIVASVDYRLAPEHPFPTAPDDCLAAYEGLVASGVDPSRIVLAGDSAGGNLALGVALRLRDEGETLPAGLALISPWVDLSCSGDSMETNANPRHLAQRAGLLASADVYLNGADPTQPLASPLFAELEQLPPTLIQVGGAETLLDESRQLERALKRASIPVQLQVFDGMVHEWHLLSALLDPNNPLEGANAAFQALASFVEEVTE